LRAAAARVAAEVTARVGASALVRVLAVRVLAPVEILTVEIAAGAFRAGAALFFATVVFFAAAFFTVVFSAAAVRGRARAVPAGGFTGFVVRFTAMLK
jgi:hypothetical protein